MEEQKKNEKCCFEIPGRNFFSMTKISGTLAKGKEILGHQNTIKKIYAEVTAEKKTPTS